VSAGRTSDRLHVRWPDGLQMKFDVYERVRDSLHGVGGVREGFAQVLDRCFSLRVHVLSSVALPGSMSSSGDSATLMSPVGATAAKLVTRARWPALMMAGQSLHPAEREVVSRESAEERRQRDADQKAEPGGPPG
jgi:hypothetical protein